MVCSFEAGNFCHFGSLFYTNKITNTALPHGLSASKKPLPHRCEVTTPEKWDGISRHWQHRASAAKGSKRSFFANLCASKLMNVLLCFFSSFVFLWEKNVKKHLGESTRCFQRFASFVGTRYVRKVGLVIIDEIHLLGQEMGRHIFVQGQRSSSVEWLGIASPCVVRSVEVVLFKILFLGRSRRKTCFLFLEKKMEGLGPGI